MRGQLTGNKDRRGAVRAADNADGARLPAGKAQPFRAQIGGKNAQLGSRAQQKAFGVGNERAKIGHSADTQENKRRIDAQLNAHIEHIAQAAAVQDIDPGGVQQHLFARADEVFHMDDPAAGQVRQDHAECDGQQQQGLEPPHDRQIQQAAAHHQHH